MSHYPLPPDTQPTRLWRDLAALACLFTSVAGIIVMLFLIDWRAGAIAVFLLIGAVGAYLGMDNGRRGRSDLPA